jgi:hypothetical protein
MSHSTIQGLVGLFLFVSGLIALYAVSTPEPARVDDQVAINPQPRATSATPTRIVEVGPQVQQALTEAGRAEVLGAEAMSQIPPEVARVLIENGVVLTVPAGGNP